MNRKALIIGSPGMQDDDDYLEGVEKDLAHYRSFLLSPLGGAWKDAEITILRNPSRLRVRLEMSSLSDANYSLAVYSGHGFYSAVRHSTFVVLREGVHLDSLELRDGAAKHTLMLDCCRRVVPIPLFETLDKALAKAARMLDSQQCRFLYDARIDGCSPSSVTMFSCGVDEVSNENDLQGGHYSWSLMDGARAWLDENATVPAGVSPVLSVVGAHRRAAESVQRLSRGLQNPGIDRPRSGPYFPFAVIS